MRKTANCRDVFFQILQYNNVEVTMNCVYSILKMDCQERIGIVIIDNNSPDGAGELLVNRMQEECRMVIGKKQENDTSRYNFEHQGGCCIDIICRNVNDGFSKGNNYGYRYIVEHYSINYLIVANSDIEFGQANFIELIENEYEKSAFDILGPDIWAPLKAVHQNPLSFSIPTLFEVNRTIFLNQISLLLFPVIYPLLRRKVGVSKANPKRIEERKEGICLQGSCLIYSKKYIDVRKRISISDENNTQISYKLFYPETNFYYEEFLQTLWCRKYDCKMIYTPDIHVVHMEGQSTSTISKDEKKRTKFRMANILNSAKIYREQLREYRNKC